VCLCGLRGRGEEERCDSHVLEVVIEEASDVIGRERRRRETWVSLKA
jgi:hypothetical protein